MALLLGGVLAWGVVQFNSIDRVDVDLKAAEDLEPRNFLVVGSDTRDLGDDGESSADAGGIYGNGKDVPPSGKRADTIVIARADPKVGSIELLSVPRDLWVTTKSGSSQRINSSYNSGPQELIDTIERNLGIPINNYVEVNFNGFKGLVDALRGVPIYFDRPVRDSNTGLNIRKPGCYNLDGVQALAFARSRHLVYSDGTKWISDKTGDLGRITRQQIFLRHALAKVTTLGLDDVNSLRVLATVAVDNVTVDDSLGITQMISLAKHFADFDAGAMVVHRLTTEPFRTKAGADVLRISKTASQPVIDIFTGQAKPTKVDPSAPPTTMITPSAVTVSVKNGSGIALLAKKVGDELAALGFEVGEIGNLDITQRPKTTTVAYGTGAEAQAVLVSSKLSPTPKAVADPNLPAGAVELRLMSEPTVAPAGATSAGATPVTAAPAKGGAAPGSSGAAPTTAPASGAGTVTPEKTVGLNIGDAPPGVDCG